MAFILLDVTLYMLYWIHSCFERVYVNLLWRRLETINIVIYRSGFISSALFLGWYSFSSV